MQRYRIIGKTGEGTFSDVLKCQSICDGTLWACKKMKQTYESIEQVNNLREVQALKRLNSHMNILQLHEVIFESKSGSLMLICELMDMNLYEMIRGKRQYFPEVRVANLIYQLLKAVDHMHRNGIFHRDIKPENILIKNDVLKLADFGSCRSINSRPPFTEYISTRWYRAPECLLTDGCYNYKMDIWSIGCVFYEVLSLKPLFPGSNEVDQITKIHDIVGTPNLELLNKMRSKSKNSMSYNFGDKQGKGISLGMGHVSAEAVLTVESMCMYDPEQRRNCKQILRTPYFKQFRDADKRLERAAQVPPSPSAVTSSRHVPSTSPRVSVGHRQRPYRPHDKENTDLTPSLRKHKQQQQHQHQQRQHPVPVVALQGVTVVNGANVPPTQTSGLDPSSAYNTNIVTRDKLPLLDRKQGVLIRAKMDTLVNHPTQGSGNYLPKYEINTGYIHRNAALMQLQRRERRKRKNVSNDIGSDVNVSVSNRLLRDIPVNHNPHNQTSISTINHSRFVADRRPADSYLPSLLNKSHRRKIMNSVGSSLPFYQLPSIERRETNEHANGPRRPAKVIE